MFTREALGAIEELTETAWRAPYSNRVDSLSNYSHSEASGDDLIVEPLVDNAQSLSDADVARIETIALNAIEIAGRLVSHDGRVGGLVINFVLPENPDAAVVEITDYLDAQLEKARARHPDVAFYLTGDVIMNRAFADATQDDLKTLVPGRVCDHHSRCSLSAAFGMGHSGHRCRAGVRGQHHYGVCRLARHGVQPRQFWRTAHRHGSRRRAFGAYRLNHFTAHEPWSGQECGDCAIVSQQCLSGVSYHPHDGDRVSQPECIGFATFSRLGQLRGLWRVMCLRLLHDSPASDAFAPAIACASCPP